jgi:hypothetical protein
MTAIRRVLNSISGRFPELYPQLEVILEQALYTSLSEAAEICADEGLTCIAELLYNQQGVSQRMWGFYGHIIQIYVQDQGILDEHITQASVPLINFMVKDPNNFKSANFNGSTPIDMLFNFCSHLFKNG